MCQYFTLFQYGVVLYHNVTNQFADNNNSVVHSSMVAEGGGKRRYGMVEVRRQLYGQL